MSENPSTSNDHSQSRVQAFIEDIVRRRVAGESLSDDQVLAEFPELAELLMGELAKLRKIEEAAIRADAPLLSETDSTCHIRTPHDSRAYSPNGSVIGDFKIVREIGRGGMGIVYEARQTSLGR